MLFERVKTAQSNTTTFKSKLANVIRTERHRSVCFVEMNARAKHLLSFLAKSFHSSAPRHSTVLPYDSTSITHVRSSHFAQNAERISYDREAEKERECLCVCLGLGRCVILVVPCSTNYCCCCRCHVRRCVTA